MKPAAAALGAAALALLFAAAPAAAHQSSQSYSAWQLEPEGARIHARISQLDLSRLGLAYAATGDAVDPIAAYLTSHLGLLAGAEPCQPTGPAIPREAPEGWVVYAWSVRCPGDAPRTLASALLLDVAPSHLHFARVTGPEGRVAERVLSEAEPGWPLAELRAPEQRAGTSLDGYVVLGVEHILSGWDHLAFVLALLLLAGTLREVAVLVTAFTVAHSVTLAVATLGWVTPGTAAVEALIGYSIALVAVENGWLLSGRGRAAPLLVAGGLLALACVPGLAVGPAALLGLALFSLCHFGLLQASQRPARLRAVVAFAFGLIHGFGFAGVLAGLELPTARLAPALLGFNVGVELGQLGVVALVWPLLRGIARFGGASAGRWVAEAGSAAVCGLGLYWFLVRSFA